MALVEEDGEYRKKFHSKLAKTYYSTNPGKNFFNKLSRYTNMASTHCTLANLFGYGYWYGNSPTSNMYKGLYWSTFREKCLALFI